MTQMNYIKTEKPDSSIKIGLDAKGNVVEVNWLDCITKGLQIKESEVIEKLKKAIKFLKK